MPNDFLSHSQPTFRHENDLLILHISDDDAHAFPRRIKIENVADAVAEDVAAIVDEAIERRGRINALEDDSHRGCSFDKSLLVRRGGLV